MWLGLIEGLDISRPGAFERIGEYGPPADGG